MENKKKEHDHKDMHHGKKEKGQMAVKQKIGHKEQDHHSKKK